MSETATASLFVTDKKDFFASQQDVATVKKRSAAQTYAFLGRNSTTLEQEFVHLFKSLHEQPEKREEYWLYCFYLSLLLQNYYQAYGKLDKAKEYRDNAEAIEFFCQNHKFFVKKQAEVEADFFKRLNKNLIADIKKLITTPFHSSQIKDWLTFANVSRLLLVFSKATTIQALTLSKSVTVAGVLLDADRLINNFKATGNVFNALSVGLFAGRFIVNIGLLLKHTFFPSDAEQGLSLIERFKKEVNLRHWKLLNDGVWATVNMLTNYASYFNIAAPVANGLLAGFLFFDVCMLVYNTKIEYSKYSKKKDEYMAELARLRNDATQEAINGNEARILMISQQLQQLEIEWQATLRGCKFNIAAAILLLTAVTASFFIAAPAGLAVMYLLSVVAIAMYFTADYYQAYQAQKLRVEHLTANSLNTKSAIDDMEIARKAFMWAMIRSIAIPMIVTATFAICWPAAIGLVVAYIGYLVAAKALEKPQSKENGPIPEPEAVTDETQRSLLAAGMA